MPVLKPIISKVTINGAIATMALGGKMIDLQYTEKPGFGRSNCQFGLLPESDIIPKIGDYIELQVMYEGDDPSNYMTTGTHRVNDVIFDHVRKIYNIGMSAYDFNNGAFSEVGYSYDNASIRAIVLTQAAQLNLTVDRPLRISGAIAGFELDDDLGTFRFAAQTRAEILEKLADEYGFLLRVKAGQMFFYDFLDFEAQAADYFMSPVDVTRDANASTRETTDGCYSDVKVVYYDDEGTLVYGDLPIEDSNVSNKVLNLSESGRLSNIDSAARYAYGAARKANKEQTVFTATCEGNYKFVLGATIELRNFGNLQDLNKFDYKYFIRKCVHTLRKSDSWRTMIELQRIFTI